MLGNLFLFGPYNLKNFKIIYFRVHVRRGLKIIEEAKPVELKAYMFHVKDFYDKYFLKYRQFVGKVKKIVYLVTDDLKVLDEAIKK